MTCPKSGTTSPGSRSGRRLAGSGEHAARGFRCAVGCRRAVRGGPAAGRLGRPALRELRIGTVGCHVAGRVAQTGHVRGPRPALAVLPPAVIQALPPDAVLVYDSAVTTYGSFEPPSGIAFHPDSRLDPEFEEGILQEIGHVLDARLGSVSERAWWKKDQSRHVSDYAETDDAEDFAESFVAWAAYRRDLARPASARRTTAGQRTHVRERIMCRMAWFDRELMAAVSTANGRLFLPKCN